MAEEKPSLAKETANAAASSALQKGAVALASRLATLAGGTLGPAGAIVAKLAADQLYKLRKQIASLAVAVPAVFVSAFAAGGAAALSTITGGVIIGAFVVMLILFVINSGAYIVPPSGILEVPGAGLSSTIDNPFIGITKTVNPKGPLPNGTHTVRYTVTVLAKKGELTNVKVENKCTVLSRGTAPACNPPAIDANAIPGIIPAGESRSYEYQMTYNSPDFNDALITDTITVTAIVAEAGEQLAAGSASLIIGSPPTGCFEFAGDWPEASKNIATAAAADIMATGKYAETLCGGGVVRVYYRPQNEATYSNQGGYAYSAARRIHLYPAAFYWAGKLNKFVLLHTLAHESGHIYDYQRGRLWKIYLDSPAGREWLAGRGICTYPRNPHPVGEDLAELIGRYISDPTRVAGDPASICLGGSTFRQKFPIQWQWAHDNIFN